MLPKIAISVGDLNGIGIEIALKSHEKIRTICEPIYCINKGMLEQASKLLNYAIPENFSTSSIEGHFKINPGEVDASSGEFSYNSFMQAIKLCESGDVDAIITLPIHKEAWSLAGLDYVGHTDLLRDHFKKDAIMMLGCEKMFVALYTEHIPLRNVVEEIKKEPLIDFFKNLHKSVRAEKIAVLGVNPHAGDNGVLGQEDKEIALAIKEVNSYLQMEIFDGPLVPDIAFTPNFRDKYRYYAAMYHDQGLGPLKALYFDESINVSLNLPILRASVDHGTAFDIAYKNHANSLSYENAFRYTVEYLRQSKDITDST